MENNTILGKRRRKRRSKQIPPYARLRESTHKCERVCVCECVRQINREDFQGNRKRIVLLLNVVFFISWGSGGGGG